MAERVVLRSSDPRRAALEAEGWRLVGESWGARLRLGEPPELSRLRAAVEGAARQGVHVVELGLPDVEELAALESVTHGDYPQLPATPHAALTSHALRGMFNDGCRAFGARGDGRLLAATVIRPGEPTETEFTSVLPAARRRGLAKAVKAASVLALAAEGRRVFATGGAAQNTASIRMNIALGYVLEETWHSYERR